MTSELDRRSASRLARAAMAFVLLTLAALVLVPALVQMRVSELRSEIEASEPARTMVLRLQYNLVLEMASLSELQLSGDTAFGSRYLAARRTEERLFRQLRPLARELGPSALATLAEAERLTMEWHRELADTTIIARPRELADSGRAVREPERFDVALAAAMRVDSTVLAVTDAKRTAIGRVEQLGLRISFALGVLALLAALAVARLYGRVRRFGEESDRERRQAEAALEESARANEARTRLIRGVTHDVKNPLGAAKGFAELLTMGVKGPVPDGQREYLHRIQRLLDNALAIITDLLDVARADSGGLAIHPQRIALGVLVRDAADAHRAAAETAGHRVECEVDAADALLETDPLRVQQVLGNLLTNAIKYTPSPGRILVRARVAAGRRHRDDGPWAMIDVADSGPGIPESQRETIFDEFSRIQEDSGIQGHGLGLAIARRIARLLGGELSVADAEGGGAQFTLWLPLTNN